MWDDKYFVIIAVTIIATCAIWAPAARVTIGPETKELLNVIITGLFGIAVGRGMSR